jgi:hypothetical protein
MTPRRFALLSAAFTVGSWAMGMILATLAAYIYARIRGDLLPNGTISDGGTLSHWVGINFRTYLPPFLLVGSVLGVAVGQAQFWMWLKLKGNPDNHIRS